MKGMWKHLVEKVFRLNFCSFELVELHIKQTGIKNYGMNGCFLMF
jgi:hypothetical protein